VEIGWTDCVKNEELLKRVKDQGNLLHKIKGKKAN
jgi:hypothetical protein